MPRSKTVKTASGQKVRVVVEVGREYERRVELRVDERRFLYGVEEEDGRPVADLLAAYESGELAAVGEDVDKPNWVEAALTELDVQEVDA